MRNVFAVLIALSFVSTSGFSHGTGIVAEEIEKTTTTWNGDTLPAYPEGQPEITLLKITIPPQTRLPLHKHPVINCGYLLEGVLHVTADDGSVLEMEEGDSIVELVDQWHYGKNPGEEPAVILVFYAGVVDKPITVIKDGEME